MKYRNLTFIMFTYKSLNLIYRMKNTMTFTEVLESEFYYLIESIEHGSSDDKIIENYKKELYKKTGYKYIS
jgi:hypothetical protein